MCLETVQPRRAWALVTEGPSFLALPLARCMALGLTEFLSASENGEYKHVYLLGQHPNRTFYNGGSGIPVLSNAVAADLTWL